MESKDFLSIEHCFSPLDFSGETSKPDFDYEELKKQQKEYEESLFPIVSLLLTSVERHQNRPAPKKPTDKKKEEEEKKRKRESTSKSIKL